MMTRDSQGLRIKTNIALFSSIVAAVFAGFYWLGRLGFDNNSVLFYLKILSISYFLLFLPVTVRKAANSFGVSFTETWYNSDAAVSLFGLILVTAAGFIIPSFSLIALLPFIILGCLFFIINLIDFFLQYNQKSNVIFGILAVTFSIILIFIFCSYQGTSPPLLFEDFVREHSPSDGLFHYAICQMIKTYGIPSTGLDGVPYIPYHYGSHFIFVQISKLMGLHVFLFYQFCFTTIVIPFFLNSILSFSVDLKRYFGNFKESWDVRTDYKFWALFALPFVGFLPIRALNRLATKPSLILSESYTLGMAILFIVGAILLYFFKRFNIKDKKFRIDNFIFVVLVLPLLLGVIGVIKQPLLFLLAAVLAYLFLRLGLYKNKMLLFSSLPIIIASFIAYELVAFKYPGALKLVLFDHITRFVVADKRNSIFFWIVLPPAFFIFHFFWSWLYAGLRLCQEKIAGFIDIKSAFRERKVIDVEILLLLCAVGVLPGILFKVRGGVTGYFSDVQRWIALSFLLASFSNFSLPVIKSPFKRLKAVVLFSVLAVAVGSFLSNIFIFGKITVERYITVRGFLSNLPGAGDNQLNGPVNKFLYGPQRLLDGNEKYKMYRVLLELDKIPLSEKRKTLLFIPRSNKLYWDRLHPRSIPMVAPALTGIAMIDGLPGQSTAAEKEFPGHMWGLYRYKANTIDPSSIDASPEKVYSRVLEKGFSKLIIIENRDGNTVVTRIP
jgi:hypothetical protein